MGHGVIHLRARRISGRIDRSRLARVSAALIRRCSKMQRRCVTKRGGGRRGDEASATRAERRRKRVYRAGLAPRETQGNSDGPAESGRRQGGQRCPETGGGKREKWNEMQNEGNWEHLESSHRRRLRERKWLQQQQRQRWERAGGGGVCEGGKLKHRLRKGRPA